MNYEKKYKQLHKFINDLYPHMSEYCKEKVEGFLPGIKESEDERIRKELLDYLDERRVVERLTDTRVKEEWIAWLKKQGEQPCWKPSEEQLQTLHAQLNEGAVTYPEDKRILFTLYEDLMKIMTQEEKQGEQKPAAEVKPKFKVGDWITIKQ